ncbi:MAG: complement resistance protein TraT [Arcobacter sp.]|uniref:complement resistance protein TraT n=1 Tax=Arcobacter sp. TaxID=1872629 RepID=UPI00258FC733|nr:complement resistance protein TraT [Arcobacter sp.]MDD3008683.1 complement resistance protein TraT [Arcobacter sp.]
MKILIKSFLLLVSTLLLGVFFSGCGAASTAIEKRNLEIQTKMSDSVFLEPVSPEKQIVYVKIRNTTDKDIDIEEQVKSSISAKGFKVTNNPDEAYFMIQANVLQIGRTDETGSDSALQSGFGGGLLGAGVSAATGGSGNNIGVGAAIGAVAGLLANTMVKDIYYSMVTDVEIRQRPAINEKISQYEDNYSEQGTTSTISQNVNTNSVQWKIYRTRVVSTANQVNLEFEDAKNELQKGLAKSLSGLL